MRTTRTLRRNSVSVQYAVPPRAVPAARSLRTWARAASAMAVTIRVVGRTEGRRLNSQYRKKADATHVLSLAYGGTRGLGLWPPGLLREAPAQREHRRLGAVPPGHRARGPRAREKRARALRASRHARHAALARLRARQAHGSARNPLAAALRLS